MGSPPPAAGTWRSVYQLAGRPLAQRDSGGAVVYLHGDHLGSGSVATDQSGAVVSRQDFDPWDRLGLGGLGAVIGDGQADYAHRPAGLQERMAVRTTTPRHATLRGFGFTCERERNGPAAPA